MLSVTLRLGSDDAAILYLNGEEIHRYEGRRWLTMDEDIVHGIPIRMGLNRLVLKVANFGNTWGASVRFTRADGAPLTGVRVTLNPDPAAQN